ncbi:colicin-A [Candidatus Pantoea deserta]|uniref:Colicin-A n=1 Tax=Candidatus Pantoea deserta TaxID=1869313 RepID=A0A3N4NZ93_9GAMM|nr:colicin-A [Pantoea deserta]
MNTLNANSAANRLLYVFLLAGLTPLLIILILYSLNPESPLLYCIATNTAHLPAFTSIYNPVMTKAMDVYCKSAPLLALILFFSSLKNRILTTSVTQHVLIRSCILGPLFYLTFIYIIFFNKLELLTSGRPVRMLAENNLILLLFYMGIYFAAFLLTCAMCYIPVFAYLSIKKRR